MLINLSDVLSDQHKTVEETVPLTMGEIRMKFGKYPIVGSCPGRTCQGKGNAYLCRYQTCDGHSL